MNLQTQSSLKMHPLHTVVSDKSYNFYTRKLFEQKALYISLDELKHAVLDPIKRNSRLFITDRTESALRQARRNHTEYNIKDANKTGLFEGCVEALTDNQFRKGASNLYCKNDICQQLKKCAAQNQTVDIALQMLPNKVNTPIKSRQGILPCLSEISFLMRLFEICRIAESVSERNSGAIKFRFRAIMDGFRFQNALNIRGCDILHYQNALDWWLKTLEMDQHILLHDYETEIVSYTAVQDRSKNKKSLANNAQQKVYELLENNNIVQTLQALAKDDPFNEYENGEGKLQKLFKSILYTFHHQDLESSSNDIDHYQNQYHGILQKFYTDMPDQEWQQTFIKRTFDASINYMASVQGDKAILNDPVGTFFPDAVRMNLLPKQGQIGLNPLCTTRPDSMKPWHGICLVRLSSKGQTKIDSVSRLYAEGIGAIPVLLAKNDASIGKTPLLLMQEMEQPLFYIDPLALSLGSIKNVFENCSRFTK